uniref:RRM domain-containing protein n=1 Tax=Eutreptiella gymnastica TaxID=73025 RepID=A0A7S1HXA6_9EUGL|mmetsp:Transcript_111301/g.193141  ORF Transcript_111301/g.193141 Transcript_111301/m.193141 type:complete len:391 (+) Transcript_111301:79-1251(+)
MDSLEFWLDEYCDSAALHDPNFDVLQKISGPNDEYLDFVRTQGGIGDVEVLKIFDSSGRLIRVGLGVQGDEEFLETSANSCDSLLSKAAELWGKYIADIATAVASAAATQPGPMTAASLNVNGLAPPPHQVQHAAHGGNMHMPQAPPVQGVHQVPWDWRDPFAWPPTTTMTHIPGPAELGLGTPKYTLQLTPGFKHSAYLQPSYPTACSASHPSPRDFSQERKPKAPRRGKWDDAPRAAKPSPQVRISREVKENTAAAVSQVDGGNFYVAPPTTADYRQEIQSEVRRAYVVEPGQVKNRLFVVVNKEATQEDLEYSFSQVPGMVECQLKLDHHTGFSKGFAFVLYNTDEAAATALGTFNGAKTRTGWIMTVRQADPLTAKVKGKPGGGSS